MLEELLTIDVCFDFLLASILVLIPCIDLMRVALHRQLAEMIQIVKRVLPQVVHHISLLLALLLFFSPEVYLFGAICGEHEAQISYPLLHLVFELNLVTYGWAIVVVGDQCLVTSIIDNLEIIFYF